VIVADTNLLVYLLIPGPYTQIAERIRAKEKLWVAPLLLPYELLNVLAKYVHRGDISRDEATRVFRRGISMVELSVIKSEPVAILQMSEQSGCSTYDLEFVWLAIELGIQLITADKQVLASYPNTTSALDQFV
jgi:predicted nucleic acid-binding protein